MKKNIACQCSEQSFYYAWSALGLRIKDLALEERLKRMESLFQLFCIDNYQTLC